MAWLVKETWLVLIFSTRYKWNFLKIIFGNWKFPDILCINKIFLLTREGVSKYYEKLFYRRRNDLMLTDLTNNFTSPFTISNLPRV